jgi:hypothetical protein
LAKLAVGKAAIPFANRTLPTAVASLLAKVTASELTASPLRQRRTWLLAKLSQQGRNSCWRRALSHHLKRQRLFPNSNSETLLGKPSPTVFESSPTALSCWRSTRFLLCLNIRLIQKICENVKIIMTYLKYIR